MYIETTPKETDMTAKKQLSHEELTQRFYKRELTDAQLTQKLYELGGIKVTIPEPETPGDGISIEVSLHNIICRDVPIRLEVARMFTGTLNKLFADTMRPGDYRYACVGTHAIAAIMGLLPCPIVTIAPDTLATPRPHVRGKLGTDYPSVLVDDLLKTGETLSRELAFLLHIGYNIGHIVVFYDRETGGQERIRGEYKELSRKLFGREQDIEIVVLMPQEKIVKTLMESGVISHSRK